MNDTYVELLVKKPELKAASWLHNIMIGLGAVLFLIGLFSQFLITISGLLLCGGAYVLMQNACIEYEYLYLDKELSVDKIKNQSKRKKVAVYDLSTLEVMAPKGSHRLDSYDSLKVKDYSSESEDGEAFELVVEGKNGREHIIIDTNEELVKAIRMAAPRRVFTD
ncbi:MAG: hypothetical protein HDR00_09445 [Lachnospiraceae bacterium]|nr:hypothetical protein [Lachnospiraceae bacterium]